MAEDYFCSPSDVESENDRDTDSNFTDEEWTTDTEIAVRPRSDSRVEGRYWFLRQSGYSNGDWYSS